MINFGTQDMEIFRSYCSCYNGFNLNNDETAPVSTLLKPWAMAKDEYLYRLMGEQLILEKHVTYERSGRELEEEIQKIVNAHKKFRRGFEDALFLALGGDTETHVSAYSKYCYGWDGDNSIRDFYTTLADSICTLPLIKNRIQKRITATVYDKRITINKDEKIMRAVRRVCELICRKTNDLNLLDDFEQFRLDLSRAMGDRAISGTMCLSIHPLDFATASDNSNDWSSCMSWREGGCYRLGTTEMLNSPMVICAYLKSDVQRLEWGFHTWNSKRWRAWIIVTPDLILCNRNYPFSNDTLSHEAIEWVRELAAEHMNWHYATEVKTIDEWREQNLDLYFTTNHMYNDTEGNESTLFATVNEDRIAEALTKDRAFTIETNYSGLAECMHCGATDPDVFDANETLLCEECNNIHHCSCCGYEIGESAYFDPDGNALCEDCFFDRCGICTECGETDWIDNMTTVAVPYNKTLFNKLTNTNVFSALDAGHYMCSCCSKSYNLDTIGYNHPFIEESSDYREDGYDQEFWVDPRSITPETYGELLCATRYPKNVIATLYEDYKQRVLAALKEEDE